MHAAAKANKVAMGNDNQDVQMDSVAVPGMTPPPPAPAEPRH
jgi:hypothetical protein